MHRPDSGSSSKLGATGRRPFGRTPNRVLAVGFIAPAVWLVAGCSSPGGDLISTVALPSEQSARADGDAFDVVASPDPAGISGQPDLTESQRGYLDALRAAGVQPSNDLRALSIGAYVCQARAAGQSDQALTYRSHCLLRVPALGENGGNRQGKTTSLTYDDQIND